MPVYTPQTPFDESVIQEFATLYTPSITFGDGEE